MESTKPQGPEHSNGELFLIGSFEVGRLTLSPYLPYHMAAHIKGLDGGSSFTCLSSLSLPSLSILMMKHSLAYIRTYFFEIPTQTETLSLVNNYWTFGFLLVDSYC